MSELKLDISNSESPILAVKITDADFSYGNFGGPSAEAEEAAAQSTEKAPGEYSYERILRRSAGIIDSAANGALAGAQAAAELKVLFDACDFQTLKMQISQWICDICLISDTVHLIPELCECDPVCKEFKIFLFIKDVIAGVPDTEKLLTALPYMCGYDYRASKFYKENEELYSRIFSAALPEFVLSLLSECGLEIFTPRVVRACRTTFNGALCRAKSVKKVELEYLSFSECGVVIDAVTSAVRYCDNLARQALGESSRLSGISLSGAQRRIISNAVRCNFPGLLPEMQRVGRKPKITTVKKEVKVKEDTLEKLDLNIDFGIAKDLLEKSFEISELFGSFDEGEEVVELSGNFEPLSDVQDNADKNTCEVSGDSEWEEFAGALTIEERQVLTCLILGGDIYELSRRLSGMPLGFADAINEKAQDICGDIVICEQGDGLCVISDYIEIISELIKAETEEK